MTERTNHVRNEGSACQIAADARNEIDQRQTNTSNHNLESSHNSQLENTSNEQTDYPAN